MLVGWGSYLLAIVSNYFLIWPDGTRMYSGSLICGAERAVLEAVRRGVLHRPETCSRCGRPPKAGRKIEAHHHLGYEVERWLDVKWLCKQCHNEITRQAVTPWRLIAAIMRLKAA